MDPQHRLVLEVSWEALENAAQNPERLAGQDVGVFLGMSTADYGAMWIKRDDPATIDAYFGIGNAFNAAAGRVAYLLGFHGPAVAVDTACSSSLVAIHLACQGLRARDCRMALAGGVNAILTPDVTVNFSRARMMAPDGRCKTFDAAADGYVRGEGCGIVVLKRLSDALADRDRILAIVRGSAVNQDGRSSGFTAPNELAQQAVIRKALQNAGIKPSDVQYLEAHGTGTSLGDPIEVQAAAAVLGEGRAPQRPLALGSAKTNIGHLEAAAGVAGLIKIVLSLDHGELPPHLNFRTPNPYIPWADLNVKVVDGRTDWAPGSERRTAGVSSFGFSGTNAHVIVEEAPARERRAPLPDRPRHVFVISAKTDAALRDLAQRYIERLGNEDAASLADVCFTAGAGRAHFAHRLALCAESIAGLRASLEGFVHGAPAIAGEISRRHTAHGVAFVFAGHRAAYPGMGRRLYETQPVFRAAVDRCDEIMRPQLERSLVEVLYPAAGVASAPADPVHGVPALFAVEYALAELWRSWGIHPAAVIGDDAGEYAAACVGGVLPLESALALAAARGRLMRNLADGAAPAANTAPIFDAFQREVAAAVSFRVPALPVILNVTGEVASADFAFDAAYWRKQASAPGRFADGLATLVARGSRIFLEPGPPAMRPAPAPGLSPDDAVWVASLDKEHDDWEQLLEGVCRLHVSGCSVDWEGFDRPYVREKVSLPTYPFQRERYWIDPAPVSVSSARHTAPVDGSAWVHRIEWREQPLAGADGSGAGSWLLLADAGDVCRPVVQRIRAAGGTVTVLPFADRDRSASAVRADVETFVRTGQHGTVRVVSFWALESRRPTDDPLAAQEPVAGALIGVAQALLAAGVDGRLAIVTSGAQGPGGIVHADQAAGWGVAAALAVEHPELRPRCIDLDPESPTDAGAIYQEVAGAGEPRVAWRGGRRFVARLVRASAMRERMPALDPSAAYLVTGGFGGVGRHVVSWLVDRGARRVAVLARSGPSDAGVDVIRNCERLGATVRAFACDVTSAAQVAATIAALEGQLGPLRGVIHAAGVLDDGVVEQQTSERVVRVLAPKIAGAVHLHHATGDRVLDFFVLFSSMAGVTGSAAQTAYAAANAFLDAFAFERRQAGRTALSISWGPFAEGGMASGVGTAHQRRWMDAGVGLMAPGAALSVLEHAIAGGATHLVVGDVDWDAFVRGAAEGPGLLDELATPRAGTTRRPSLVVSDLLAAPPEARARLVADFCTRETAAVLRLTAVRTDQSLYELGVDSLMAIEIRNRLQRATGVVVPVVAFLDGITVADLAARVLAGMEGARAVSPPARLPAGLSTADADALLSRFGELTDSEVDALLAGLGGGDPAPS